MLGLDSIWKKTDISIEETLAAIRQGDQEALNTFIDSYKPFIAKTVSSVCKRYIDESDDEFSIGLIAFNDAIDKYDAEKGKSLLNFAEVIIKNRVIDYIRKQSRHQNNTIHLNPSGNSNDDYLQNQFENNISIEEYRMQKDDALRKEEIIHFTKKLSEFKLSFQDLVKNSPKHHDARKNAMIIAQTIANHDDLKQFLLDKKRLPMKELEQLVLVSRKTVERNRKYIIAITLIFLGDYHYLKDYIKGVLES